MELNQNSEDLQSVKAKVLSLLQRKIILSETKLASLKDNFNRCAQWKELQHEAMLLQSHFALIKKRAARVEVEDWNREGALRLITLNPDLSPAENIAQKYKLSKRLKRGLEAAKTAYQKQEQLVHTQRQQLESVQTVEDISALETLLKSHAFQSGHIAKKGLDTSIPVKLPYKLYKSAKGMTIWVGKGARQNDEMTFKRAKGLDWWCHVEGGGGAHVVIKARREEEVDPETLQDAFQLALANSSLRHLRYASVILTQCKHIRSMGKSFPGKVQIAKGKSYSIQRDPERLKRVIERDT